MISVTIDVVGVKQTTEKLNKIINAFSDWTPELKSVGEFLKGFYSIAGFASEGSIFGARWAALNPQYEYWKRLNYPGRGILVKGGDMQQGFRYNVVGNSMELTNIAGYAKYHQSGTSKMPKRQIAHVDDPRQKEIVNIFKQGIIKKIQNTI